MKGKIPRVKIRVGREKSPQKTPRPCLEDIKKMENENLLRPIMRKMKQRRRREDENVPRPISRRPMPRIQNFGVLSANVTSKTGGTVELTVWQRNMPLRKMVNGYNTAR